ncbi:MAG: ABC transporter ATP-binding protein [Arenicellales bacterium WSBS_2016_MAG_OTU3]
MSSESLVELTGIHFGFTKNLLYKNVDMTIPRGRVTVVLGPSGCGKSTLLGLIGGRLRPAKGEIFFDGERVNPRKRAALYGLRKKMGMLFQHNALLTDLNVFDNLAFALREHTDLPERLIRHLILIKLHMVGLRGARDLMPHDLSGGMARRVALARAVVTDPQLVMYDEPFTGLDPIAMGIILRLIRELNNALGLTSVIVTHDITEGLDIADYAYLLGNGGVIARGTPDELRNNDSELVQQFLQGLPDGPVAYHYPAAAYEQDLRNNL